MKAALLLVDLQNDFLARSGLAPDRTALVRSVSLLLDGARSLGLPVMHCRTEAGDDALALFLGAATGDGSDATRVDVYGVIGVDVTGEIWEHTDGYSFRSAGATASAAFDPTQWVLAL